MNPLLNGMNDRQAEAVQTTEGPLLIMAGAGSGKTRVLTHRIAYLIDEKMVNPWNILAITFTNKAAREMKERAYGLNPATQDCLIATFHSMCVRILRRDADHIGYNRNFTIIDPGEQRTLMKRILKQLNLDPKKWNERTILGTISNAKNDLIDDVAFAAQAGDLYADIVAKCYTAYQKELRQSESVDFDDLIMLTLRLFDQNPDVLTYYQQKFQYIHVDEYQDTNHAQYQLVKLLASRFKNICVVGDADQSIYGWRGADMQNILDFEKDYPQAKVVLLEENYRSTKTILQAANDVIKNNKNRRPKNLWTQNADGEQIVYYRANALQPMMGLTSTEQEGKVTKNDTLIGKNYLNEKEIGQLKLIVEQFLAYAEAQALAEKPMYMRDWLQKLRLILTLNEKNILEHAGTISHELAVEKASKEYIAYKEQQRSVEHFESIKQLDQDLKRIALCKENKDDKEKGTANRKK